MKFSLLLILNLMIISLTYGQNQKLANQYYITGEYEKAAKNYEKLCIKSPKNNHYFERFISSLTEMEDYEGAAKAIKKKLKSNKKQISLYVSLGKLHERQGQEKEALKLYQKAIDNLDKNPYEMSKMGNAFIREGKLDMALSAYEEGIKHVEKPNTYAYNMGDLYYRMGKSTEAIKYFLLSIEDNPQRARSLKTFFQRNFDDAGFDILIESLYNNIQEKPEMIQFPELLQWTFVTRKAYKKALRQAKAMDLRFEEDGKRVYSLGMTAFRDNDYETAIDAFAYIVDTKDKNSGYFLIAKKELLNVKRTVITLNPNYTPEQLASVVADYESFLNLYGKNNQTGDIMIEYAKLNAEYKQDHKKAIEILNELISLNNIKKDVLAEAKLSLGDYYIIDGEIWEATLLYSQVDKAFKEAVLGEKARFKNAKLSYYNGDFEWAQTQFDFLKSATSKLISNDAIDLSVFITDNLGLDSTETAMRMYANADLLLFQNKDKEALTLLETMMKQFPSHTLLDDVLYIKAKMYTKKKMLDEAIAAYQKIVKDYPEDIRADNALYEMALIYETYLGDMDKAIHLYEKLFIDYAGSTLAVDARKRYRYLRGDNVQ